MPTQLDVWQCNHCRSVGSLEEATTCEEQGIPVPEFKVGDQIPFLRASSFARDGEDPITKETEQVLFGFLENFKGEHRWVYLVWDMKPSAPMSIETAREKAKEQKVAKTQEPVTAEEIQEHYNESQYVHGLVVMVLFRKEGEIPEEDGLEGYICVDSNRYDPRFIEETRSDVSAEVLALIGM